MKASVYTRKGDLGETGFLDGKRVRKDNPRVEAVGSVDELNTQIGLVIAQIKDKQSLRSSRAAGLERYEMLVRKKGRGKWKEEIVSKLEKIQNDLFVIGSLIAGYEPNKERIEVSKQQLEDQVKKMEKEIDLMWEKLPALRNFILPGGSLAGAQIHLARTVCRRAERRVIGVGDSGPGQNDIKKYLNRLSDYLFTLARWANFKAKRKEIVWRNLGK